MRWRRRELANPPEGEPMRWLGLSAQGATLADRLRDLAEVIVELVVASGQPVHARLRDRAGIEVRMRRRGSLVIEPVEDEHRHARRKPRSEVARQLELV